jgi:hypothetical protein
MADLIARAVNAHLDVYTRSPEFRSLLTRLVRWGAQGYECGFGPKERRAFTASVAGRIREKARSGHIRLFGVSLWKTRYPYEWCEERAEAIVTEWLRDERMKFGDPRFYWSDGIAIADEEMSNWERLA